MKIINCQLAMLFLAGCGSKPSTNLKEYHSETLKVEKLSEHIFQHISYLETEQYGKVECNGMVFIQENEILIYDAPTNDKASKELIEWVGNKNIKGVVVTHFHVDCLGGLAAFHAIEIPSFAHSKTIQLAKKEGVEIPQQGFDDLLEFNIGGRVAIAKYYGQGHTKDNIIGYVPSEKTLFGGCLIKSLHSGKGNLSDANVKAWPQTVESIQKELPNIEKVIPGHGESGSAELLNYTINLFSGQ